MSAARHVGLRPLELVQCHLCKEYGHYANDPRCPVRNRMPIPSPSHSSVPVFSSPSMHYFSSPSSPLVDASQIQFRDGVTVFDAIKNLMADNIALKKEVSELRQLVALITNHPAFSSVVVANASSSSSSSSVLPSSASRRSSPPRSSSLASSLFSLMNSDSNEGKSIQEMITMADHSEDAPAILGPLRSLKKKKKKGKEK